MIERTYVKARKWSQERSSLRPLAPIVIVGRCGSLAAIVRAALLPCFLDADCPHLAIRIKGGESRIVSFSLVLSFFTRQADNIFFLIWTFRTADESSTTKHLIDHIVHCASCIALASFTLVTHLVSTATTPRHAPSIFAIFSSPIFGLFGFFSSHFNSIVWNGPSLPAPTSHRSSQILAPLPRCPHQY